MNLNPITYAVKSDDSSRKTKKSFSQGDCSRNQKSYQCLLGLKISNFSAYTSEVFFAYNKGYFCTMILKSIENLSFFCLFILFPRKLHGGEARSIFNCLEDERCSRQFGRKKKTLRTETALQWGTSRMLS